jgi:hypothetical protein
VVPVKNGKVDDLIQRLVHRHTEPLLPKLDLPHHLAMLELHHPPAAQRVDRAPLRRRHHHAPGRSGIPAPIRAKKIR